MITVSWFCPVSFQKQAGPGTPGGLLPLGSSTLKEAKKTRLAFFLQAAETHQPGAASQNPHGPGHVAPLAARLALVYPGGKGCNVARTVGILGGRARLMGFCGLKEKKASRVFFASFRVDDQRQEAPGRSRTCLLLKDTGKNQETVINSPSQLKLRAGDLAILLAGIRRGVKKGDWVTLSGSVPEGLPSDSLACLAKAAAINGARVIVDSNGQGLRRSLAGHPFMIKPNQVELEELLGRRLPNGPGLKEILSPVFAKGVRQVILTLGNKGALAITPKGILKSLALKVKGPLSPVGCGDAFLGGLVWALDQGRGMSCALQWASASATANLLKPGAVFMTKAEITGWNKKAVVTGRESGF